MRRRRNLRQFDVLKPLSGRRKRRRRQRRRRSLRRLLQASVVEKLDFRDGGLLSGRSLVADSGEVARVVRVFLVVLAAELLVIVVVRDRPRLGRSRQV